MINPILVVEDDRKMARMVRAYLEGAGFTVLHSEKGREAIAAAIKEKPLLVILDLKLPDISGEEVCQELKEIGDFPIVMLTSKSLEEERITGFVLGADDYVVKPFSPRELVYRVKAVLKRAQKKGSGEAAELSFNEGVLKVDGQSYQVIKNGLPVKLTPTEVKILFTLASSPQKVFTRESLAESALGYQFEGYERSIDAHIKHIRQKIGDDPRSPVFILTIYGVGYKFIGKPDA